MSHRKYGWKRQLPDHRDFQYGSHREMKAAPLLPSYVDLRLQMSPIENQGQLGSCVAHATAGMLEYLELSELKTNTGGKEVFPDHQFDLMSRLYLYFNARAIDGNTNEDNGTHLRSAMKAIRKWGICREVLWPYNPIYVNANPPKISYTEGAQHLIMSYYALNNQVIDQLKQCLAQAYPFIFGISVYESFERAAHNGLVPMPSLQEQPLGGHALCCVGYDDVKEHFIVRNSWSDAWGDKGYCYIPYAYLLNPNLASDFWTVRKE